MELRKFRALVSETGMDDFGASGMVFDWPALVKGDVYEQANHISYGYKNPCDFIVDGCGCSRNIDRSISMGLIEEICSI